MPWASTSGGAPGLAGVCDTEGRPTRYAVVPERRGGAGQPARLVLYVHADTDTAIHVSAPPRGAWARSKERAVDAPGMLEGFLAALESGPGAAMPSFLETWRVNYPMWQEAALSRAAPQFGGNDPSALDGAFTALHRNTPSGPPAGEDGVCATYRDLWWYAWLVLCDEPLAWPDGMDSIFRHPDAPDLQQWRLMSPVARFAALGYPSTFLLRMAQAAIAPLMQPQGSHAFAVARGNAAAGGWWWEAGRLMRPVMSYWTEDWAAATWLQVWWAMENRVHLCRCQACRRPFLDSRSSPYCPIHASPRSAASGTGDPRYDRKTHLAFNRARERAEARGEPAPEWAAWLATYRPRRRG